MCVVADVKLKGILNMDVKTAAKVQTHSIMCNEMLTDRNQNYDACSKQAIRVTYQLSGNFVKLKFNFSPQHVPFC